MFHRAILATFAALALAGCGDSTGSQDDGAGKVKFTYSGYVSGTFDASGIAPATGAAEFGAALLSSGGWLTIIAVDDNGKRRGNMILLRAAPRVGSSTCAPGSAREGCEVRAEFYLGSRDPEFGVDDIAYGHVGTIHVKELTAERARGTFSVEAKSSYPAHASVPFKIVNGSFDVPIVPEDALNGVVFKDFPR